MPLYPTFKVSVVVAGGSGSAVFNATGEIWQMAIIPPGSSSSRMFIRDAESYPVERRDFAGDTNLIVNKVVNGVNTVSVSGPDGTYKFKFWMKTTSS